MKAKFHYYDFDRTALDGTRVLCGRDIRDVSWRASQPKHRSKQPPKDVCKICYAKLPK